MKVSRFPSFLWYSSSPRRTQLVGLRFQLLFPQIFTLTNMCCKPDEISGLTVDVTVIGAGPAGLALTTELCKRSVLPLICTYRLLWLCFGCVSIRCSKLHVELLCSFVGVSCFLDHGSVTTVSQTECLSSRLCVCLAFVVCWLCRYCVADCMSYSSSVRVSCLRDVLALSSALCRKDI